ncbi:hypothetical protein N7466_011169 [Penicillium verhagenii]|uniref:uncharacterized protein n=1 Tax=Penicillium verhagenii TaxID=1562060 RepID=UPI002544D806|nr:uncharacterized protein N7466_011169 [Penicillium verhagenii]KAJ5917615.1 hypothetical protein N7466_011169 [Penicillium verhagenii]
MFVLVPHKHRGCGILSLLRSYLRKSHFRKHQQECEYKETPAQSTKPPTHPTKNAHPETNDTDFIVQQLAALAATVSRVSTNDANTSIDSNGWTEKDQEGESFDYLRSLITVSYLAPNPPETTTTTPNQSLPVSPPLRRKRASSRLSLRLDVPIPSLSFPPKAVRKPKASPRYTILPPAYTAKPISIRPEVRF